MKAARHIAGQAFAGRSVLVTGHTGFKGSWLSIWLHALGARVSGYALAPPTTPSNFAACNVGELLAAHHQADLRDAAALRAALESAAPEVVFHLAAQPLVRESYASPRETFDVNVMGTVNLLEAIRVRGRPCAVLVITSDKCYENREQIWGYREIDALGGHDPYSASKGAVEIAVAAYRRSFFPPGQLSPARSEALQRAGRQRHRRRRLGQGPHRDRCGSPPPGRPTRAGPQSAGHPALAACPGALERLPDAGRANAPGRRSGLVRGLEFRPPARRGNSRWADLWSCSSRPGAAVPGRT